MLKDWFLIHSDSLVDCELINTCRYYHISGGYFLWSCQKYCLINTVNVKISAWEDIYSIYPSTSALKKVVTRSYPSGKVFKKIIHRKKSTFVYSEIEQLVLNISTCKNCWGKFDATRSNLACIFVCHNWNLPMLVIRMYLKSKWRTL